MTEFEVRVNQYDLIGTTTMTIEAPNEIEALKTAKELAYTEDNWQRVESEEESYFEAEIE